MPINSLKYVCGAWVAVSYEHGYGLMLSIFLYNKILMYDLCVAVQVYLGSLGNIL